MPARPLELTISEARRFMLRALGLEAAHPSVRAAIEHHGYVQIDPINVSGRMHEHLLRNRVGCYGEGDLFRHLYGAPDAAARPSPTERHAFEHYFPPLGVHAAMPATAYPFLRRSMKTRAQGTGSWSGRLDAPQRKMAQHLFERLQTGPIASEDVAPDRGPTTSNGWGKSRLAKSTLDKLFFHGRVLITRRRGYRREFDLPERVLPEQVLSAPQPSPAASARWAVLTKLRQRRLCRLKRDEYPLVKSFVQEITVPGCPALHILREDLALLDEVRSSPVPSNAPPHLRLLAPLDPLIYDRDLTRRLWDFDYTWEVYTPPAKRVRGYYALPVLVGGEIVGHVDVKANRETGQLNVISQLLPDTYSFSAHEAVSKLAHFLHLSPPK